MVAWPMTSRDPERSRSRPQYVRRLVSQKRLKIPTCWQRSIYRKWILGNEMGHVTDDVTWPWRSRSWPQNVLCPVSQNGWRYRLCCKGVPIGNGVWRVVWSGARCRCVFRSSYSELITYCHSTFTIDKIAWKYRKTAANIIEKKPSLSHC